MSWRPFLVAFLLPVVASAQTPTHSGYRPSIPVPQLEVDYVPPPLVAVPEGEDRITPITKGEPAPFTGQLYDPATALRWAHFLQQAKLRLLVDVVRERRVCNAHITYMGERVELERAYSVVIEEDLRGRILNLEQRNQKLTSELNNPGLFRSPIFWFFGGVVVTGVLVGAGAFIVAQ